MEAKLIKKHMQVGVWKINNTDILSHNDGLIAALPAYASALYRKESKANAAAIVTAVNATYGQNINPEKVPDMVKELERLYDKHGYLSINELLTSIKLTS